MTENCRGAQSLDEFFNTKRRHDKNYILVIFIITVCSSVAFTNCDSRHPWLAANAVFLMEIKMKILIISDAHGNVENIEKLSEQAKNADLVLFGGDFAKFNCPETGKPALEALVKNSDSIFAVLGNCDEPDFISEIEDADICVQKSMVFKDGLVIAGSGGGSKFSGDTPFERTEEELVQDFDVIKNSLSQIADDDGKCSSLVLIMHNPPKDTKADVIPGDIHVGSQKLREFIESTQPVLVVTGHIHESAGIDKIGDSTVINPGALMEGKYALAELEKTDGKWVVKSAELRSL